jgi:protein-disulfide isomerase
MATNDPRPTKDQRRNAARLKAQQMREEQKRRERRNRFIAIGGLVTALLVLVAVVLVILGQSHKTTTPTSTAQISDVTRPAGSTITGGIPFTNGAPAALDGDKIKATKGVPVVSVYYDFMCPNCGNFESVNKTDLDTLQAAGTIVLDYHPIAILDRSSSTQYSTRSAQALVTVADKDPAHFVAFDDALFVNQPQENTAGLSDQELAARALTAGVSQTAVDAFSKGTFTPWVTAATLQAEKDGVQGTPTVMIDGTVWGGNWQTAGELKKAIEVAAKG